MPCLTTNNTQTRTFCAAHGRLKEPLWRRKWTDQRSLPCGANVETPSRGVKRDIEKLWEVINKQQVIIERQRQELDRLKQIVEPLSDVLKRYTDQDRAARVQANGWQTSDQIKTNTRIDNSLATLRRSKAVTDEKVRVCTEQMSRLGAQIGSLNEEILGMLRGRSTSRAREEWVAHHRPRKIKWIFNSYVY